MNICGPFVKGFAETSSIAETGNELRAVGAEDLNDVVWSKIRRAAIEHIDIASGLVNGNANRPVELR
jgi:hypothetical protein